MFNPWPLGKIILKPGQGQECQTFASDLWREKHLVFGQICDIPIQSSLLETKHGPFLNDLWEFLHILDARLLIPVLQTVPLSLSPILVSFALFPLPSQLFVVVVEPGTGITPHPYIFHHLSLQSDIFL